MTKRRDGRGKHIMTCTLRMNFITVSLFFVGRNADGWLNEILPVSRVYGMFGKSVQLS